VAAGVVPGLGKWLVVLLLVPGLLYRAAGMVQGVRWMGLGTRYMMRVERCSV
jgi:hypothetical protein